MDQMMSGESLAAPAVHGVHVKRLSLALQGGGAHGAYTWGVLDRLLEEKRHECRGVRRRHGKGRAR
jgi:predicted acylesterase/phospholipase RssA